MTQYALLCLRALLFVICIEAAWRYLWWWWRTRKDNPGLLWPLLLGIAINQYGFGQRHVDALIYYEPVWWRANLIYTDCVIILGTLLHLFPAWRLTYRYYAPRNYAIAVLNRVAVAAVLVGVIIYFDL